MPKNATDTEMLARLAKAMYRSMAYFGMSDADFLDRIKSRAGRTKGSLRTIVRYKNGDADSTPTPQTLHLIAQALEWDNQYLDRIIDGDNPSAPSLARERQNSWAEVREYMQQISNLPYEVQKARRAADSALMADDYDAAAKYLSTASSLLKGPAGYHLEEYARSIAAQGALAFSYFDYRSARLHYRDAISLWPLPPERLDRYRNSYRIAATACMADAKTEAEARRVLTEMAAQTPPVEPNVVTFNTLMSFAKTEEEARRVLAETAAQTPPVEPDVVTFNTLMSFAKTEEEARRVLAKMAAQKPPVEPDVVTFSTLMSKIKGVGKALAVFRVMRRRHVTPDEITVISAVDAVEDFDEALAIADFALSKGWFVGRGAMEAIYAKPITHLTAAELLVEYHARTYKFDSALGNPIRQYRRARRHREAAELTIAAPHIGPAMKLYQDWYDICKDVFDAKFAEGCDDDNLYYAYGIAAAVNRGAERARPLLEEALGRAFHPKRTEHIEALLQALGI